VRKQVFDDSTKPWSLALVTAITFFLPAGGAVVAIRNMARLGEIDARRALELTVATVIVFAAGYSALLLVAQPDPNGTSTLSPIVTVLLSFGTALAAFLLQRREYVSWREAHPQSGTGAWYTAIGWGVIYQIVTAFACFPFFLVMTLISSAGA
jgi:uncharacterized membrane protein